MSHLLSPPCCTPEACHLPLTYLQEYYQCEAVVQPINKSLSSSSTIPSLLTPEAVVLEICGLLTLEVNSSTV